MKKSFKFNYTALLVLFLFILWSCNNDDGPNITPLPETNLIEVASGESDLTDFLSALERTDLTTTFQGSTNYTILAPSNSAFSTFFAANGFAGVNDVPVNTLRELLLNHVVTGLVDSANLVILGINYTETLAEGPTTGTNLALYFDATDGVVFNGTSKVTEADILASNGIIHIVDNVIELPTIKTFVSVDVNLEELETAFDLIAPVSTLPNTIEEAMSGPFTVFAPADEAFEALLDSNSDWDFLSDIDEEFLKSVIEHHILNGNTKSEELTPETAYPTLEGDDITVNLVDGNLEITDGSGNEGSIILVTDIQTANGVIHILSNQVLIPDTTN